MAHLLERINIVQAADVADINGSGITGDYVSLKGYERMIALAVYGDGTAGQDITFTVYQAQDVSGTGAKALNCLQTGRIFRKQGADFSAVAALTAWTKVTQATADDQYQPDDTGEAVGMVALEIDANDLDVTNAFDCVRVDVSDPGASKIATLLYILEAKHRTSPELLVDPLVD